MWPSAMCLLRVQRTGWYTAHSPRSPLLFRTVRGRLLPGSPGELSMVALEASLSGLQPREFQAIRLPLSRSGRFVICNGLGTSPPGEVFGFIEVPTVRNPPSVRAIDAKKPCTRCMGFARVVPIIRIAFWIFLKLSVMSKLVSGLEQNIWRYDSRTRRT